MKKYLLLAGILGLSFSSLTYSADSIVIPVYAEVLDQCKFVGVGTKSNLVFGTLSSSGTQNIIANGQFYYVCTLGTQARIEVGSDNSTGVYSVNSSNYTGNFFMDSRSNGHSENLLKYQLNVSTSSLIGLGYGSNESIPVLLTGTIFPEDYRVAKVLSAGAPVKFQNNLIFAITP